jgi:tripartite-type tricarboxylate transporter receptor subunit TctC
MVPSPTRRHALIRLGAAATAAALPGLSLAQSGGTPVRILVGFPPGGATDTVARILADRLREALGGQTLIIDNKAGAGGQIAAQALKAAAPDGNTLMLSIDHTQVIIPLTMTTAGYDAVRDFTPVAGVAQYFNALAVNSSIGVRSVPELAAWLKANPTQQNYGIPAPGSVPQFAGFILGKSIGVPLNAIPYKGGAPLIADLLGAQVPMGFASLTELIEHHRAGKLRVLATSGTVRSKTAPEIPTFQELGLKGLDKNPWVGMFGPPGLPAATVNRFNAAVRSALADAEVREKLAKLGNEAQATTAAELGQWVSEAHTHWSAVIRESGFKPA